MLTLTVLGCAGSTYDPDLRQPCSSYLLETAQVAVMLDCGFGSFSSYLENARSAPLDALFVSHAHRDHSIDLETFVKFSSAWRERPRVIASLATMDALPFNIESTEAEVIVVDDGSEVDFDVFRVECSATTHQMATLAARVSIGDSRVVYSGDTGPRWSPPTAFLRPDIALLECTLVVRTAASSPFHLDAAEAATLAQVLDARSTLIVHVPPGEDGQVRLNIAKRAMPEREFLLAATGQRVLVESSETDDYR